MERAPKWAELRAFGERIELLGFEGMHPGKIVKAHLFQRPENSEATQILQMDHNPSHNDDRIVPDSAGRFAETLRFRLGLCSLRKAAHDDHDWRPGRRRAYMLNPDQKVAHR